MLNFKTALVAGGMLLSAAIAQAAPVAVSGDPVLYWNEVLLQAIRTGATPPPRASRAMAMMNIAVADAVNAARGPRFEYYLGAPGMTYGGDTRAAASVAAHDVLVQLFPTQAATFDAALANSLALVADGTAKTRGSAMGQSRAAAVLALRTGDGSDAVVPYTEAPAPGIWRPTPPSFGAAAFPQWPDLTPFTMTSGDQFRAGPPPALADAEYTAAYNEVKELGAIGSATRTADQTELAFYWADGGGTFTPPGHWISIAADVSQQLGLDTTENARMMGLLGIAVADAAIVAWDMKYEYDFWRPITAIQEGDTDGNPDTVADPTWAPLIATPPFPGFTSGHASFSGAAATILTSLLGDGIAFCSEQDGIAVPITRCFDSFNAAALEAADSRLYGGIHFRFDNDVGVVTGSALGDYTFGNNFAAVPAPAGIALFGLGLGALAFRRRG